MVKNIQTLDNNQMKWLKKTANSNEDPTRIHQMRKDPYQNPHLPNENESRSTNQISRTWTSKTPPGIVNPANEEEDNCKIQATINFNKKNWNRQNAKMS